MNKVLIKIATILLLGENWMIQTQGGKILASLPSMEISDYRFGLGDPYIVFYERENFRGKIYFHKLNRSCTNLKENYQNWASSVDLQRRCVTLCDRMDCQGNCARVFPNQNPRIKGSMKLKDYHLNDKVASVKFCY